MHASVAAVNACTVVYGRPWDHTPLSRARPIPCRAPAVAVSVSALPVAAVAPAAFPLPAVAAASASVPLPLSVPAARMPCLSSWALGSLSD